MRMNRKNSLTAAKIVMEYNQADLERILKTYGEIHNCRRVAETILQARAIRKINTTGDLVAVINACIPFRLANQYLSKIFQALRIEVNSEMESLSDFLLQSCSLLKTGGRLVVISYHSLEDRMVKSYIKSGNIEGLMQKDVFGNYSVPFKNITHRPIVPTDEEIHVNVRARSAKLRIAEKN